MTVSIAAQWQWEDRFVRILRFPNGYGLTAVATADAPADSNSRSLLLRPYRSRGGFCTISGGDGSLIAELLRHTASAPEPPALVGELRKLVEEWRTRAGILSPDLSRVYTKADFILDECADRLAALLGEEA